MIWARWLAGATLSALLVGCVLPPPTVGGEGDANTESQIADSAAATTREGKPGQRTLKPLVSSVSAAAGAPPKSTVASVRYDLAVTGYDNLAPDDGVPGESNGRQVFERGAASFYGLQFHQRKTANGERFDMGAMTAAHKTLPFNTLVCVQSLTNGREVLVRINDRGPYAAGRIIDLSRNAADEIGMISVGIKQVALSRVGKGDICAGNAVGGNGSDVGRMDPSSDRLLPGDAQSDVASFKRSTKNLVKRRQGR